MTIRDRRWLGFGGLALVFMLASAAWAYPPPEEEDSDDRRPPPRAPDGAGPNDARDDEFPPADPEGPRPAAGDRQGPPRRPPGEGRMGRPGEPPPDGLPHPPGDRMGPGDRFRRGDMPGPRELTREQIDQFLALLQENFPHKYEQLSNARKERPAEFLRQMRRFTWFVFRLLDSDPDMRKLMIQDMRLDHEIHETMDKYQATKQPDARAPLAAQLRKLLDTQFDIRMAKSGHMIAAIERRLAEQKARRDEQIKNKDSVIEKRVKEMTGQENAMKWPEG